jgi:threonine/homoserine/homoserine lactone efflux protein
VFGFLAISALVICTPGPDTALTIRNALAGGRRGGVGTALGVATGQACWTLAASAGIAALLKASQPAFVALRLLGAAYLVWLGVTSLVAAFRGGNRHRALPRRRSAFRQGLLSNLGNPKMAVFFTSLLPQFGHSFGALLALGLAFSTMTFLWLSGYGIVVARVGDVLRRGWIRRAIDAATGAVLVALGVRVVQERG